MWRRAGESFLVGDGIEIEVLEAKPHRVKLGIVAPASVAIVRKEARITREENLAAALSADQGMIDNLLRRLPGGVAGVDTAVTSSKS
jgi:carbon storage regulator CsrA